jgi:uncharacterized membrane protein YozB (DUF420 family)
MNLAPVAIPNLSSSAQSRSLSAKLKAILFLAAIIDVILGVQIFFSPELGFALWPTTITPLLARFIGAIVAASGIGIFMAIRWGTWEGIRAQFVAGFTYGLMVLVALLYHLSQGANPVFWVYAAIDLMYLIPITLIFWSNESTP